VQKILKNNQLDVFDFVYEAKVLGQKSKVLEKIIKKYEFEKENTVYVGDETRDIEAAQKAGILSAAVGWGFNDIEVLNNLNPDIVLLNPKDLLNYIN
jgi:phosphoglycolate phosphatase